MVTSADERDVLHTSNERNSPFNISYIDMSFSLR